MRSKWLGTTALLVALCAAGQTPAGGPAATMAAPEMRAVAYLHTVYTAQRNYYKKHHEYAKSLAALVGQGSFTRRMASPDRGDYTSKFSGNGTKFSDAMVPKSFDQEHRSFFINETGVVRVEADKAANEKSPALK